MLLLKSADGGMTWDAPRNLTKTLVPPSFEGGRIYTGLPQGIQLDSGRLIICANHNVISPIRANVP